jgi:hypothetical protein
MNKLLMTTAALLVLGSAPVLAGSTVPRDMFGSYCTSDGSNAIDKSVLRLDSTDPKKSFRSVEEQKQGCGDGIFIIRANSYDGSEHTCSFTAIKSVFDRDIIATTKTMGVTRTQIDATCSMAHNSERDCTWKERFSLYRTQGYLYLRNERRYQESCK